MILSVLLLIFSGFEIELEPVDQEITLQRRINLSADGEFYAGTRNYLYIWRRDGSLRLRIGGPELSQPTSYHFDGSHYLVCEVVASGGVTHVYDYQGHHLFQADFYTHQFRVIDGDLFAFPLPLQNDTWPHEFPTQFQKLNYHVGPEGLAYSFGSPAFGKMTQKQQDLIYNFKLVWAVKVNDTYHLVNQIEPRVYHYTPEGIEKDRIGGPDFPTSVGFTTLSLDSFSQLQSYFSPPKGLYDNEEMAIMNAQWWHSFSQISGFYAYRNGFVVSYTIPQCEQGDCTDSKAVVQRLDSQFRPVGEPMETNGYFLGVYRDQLNFFHNRNKLDAKGESVGLVPTIAVEDL